MSAPLLLQGTALALPLRDASVHMICTSPPYWNLRDYNVAGQLGLEPTLEAYLAALVAVFAEVRRVLRDDGTLWLNIGDSMAAGKMGRADNARRGSIPEQRPGRHDGYLRAPAGPVRQRAAPPGLKPKDLCMVPARLALALQAEGWTLRSEIVWAKPNPMPESVTDRPTRSHEMVYLFAKSPRYFYDTDAVRETHEDPTRHAGHWTQRPNNGAAPGGLSLTGAYGRMGNHPHGRNARSVWSIPSEPFSGSHYACFPTELVRRCILAGTSAHGCCAACGAPWRRLVERQRLLDGHVPVSGTFARPDEPFRIPPNGVGHYRYTTQTTEHGWQASCACNAAVQPCRVFDPFCGSGTTLLVARELGRHSIGLDLSYPYLRDIARQRLGLSQLAAWEGRNGHTPAPPDYTALPLFAGGAPCP